MCRILDTCFVVPSYVTRIWITAVYAKSIVDMNSFWAGEKMHVRQTHQRWNSAYRLSF